MLPQAPTIWRVFLARGTRLRDRVARRNVFAIVSPFKQGYML